MNRTLFFKYLFKTPSSGCLQQRSYAIMTRAKQRAGIPLDPPTLNQKPVRTTVQRRTNKEKLAAVKTQFDHMSIRKPAGIAERLVKVNKNCVQPENPHLIKVAVIGAANAGKSTLVNKIVGEEISGVSPKAHTTRERILAVHSEDNYQIVFLDTPGVIPDHNHAKMNRTLATSSWRCLDEADHILVMVDAHRCLQPQARTTEDFLLDRLAKEKIPATLIFNKLDLIDENRELLQQVKERYLERYPYFKHTLYVSAVYEEGLEKVKHHLFDEAPQKPWIYGADQKTEMPDLKRVEEIIRVEFFKRLHQYIPYMLKQENVGWTVSKDGTLRIDQHVYVQRESQQRIVVGHQGRIIDNVVSHATEHISKALKRPVKLYIQVKARKNTVHL